MLLLMCLLLMCAESGVASTNKTSELLNAIRECLPEDWIFRESLSGLDFTWPGTTNESVAAALWKKGAVNKMKSRQATVFFVPHGYQPERSDAVGSALLIARTPMWQVVLWGRPTKYGWSNCVFDIVESLSTSQTNLEWNAMTDAEIDQYWGLIHSNQLTFDVELELWNEQARRMQPYVSDKALALPH